MTSQDDDASDIVKVSPPSSDSHAYAMKVEVDVDVQGMMDETVKRVREQSDRSVQHDTSPS